MHTHSVLITVAVGAAGIVNCMPTLGRRGPQYQPSGYGADQYGAGQYQGGGSTQGGSGFPFSLLNGVTGSGGHGGIL